MKVVAVSALLAVLIVIVVEAWRLNRPAAPGVAYLGIAHTRRPGNHLRKDGSNPVNTSARAGSSPGRWASTPASDSITSTAAGPLAAFYAKRGSASMAQATTTARGLESCLLGVSSVFRVSGETIHITNTLMWRQGRAKLPFGAGMRHLRVSAGCPKQLLRGWVTAR
jgi:hypothetical protein